MPSRVLRFPRILILLLLFTFANFLGLLITPALPALTKIFGVDSSMGTWVMSIFLIGYAVGQLLYGPVANRFGRKQAITLGMLFAFFGTIIMYVSEDFFVFCLGRFIQALGAAVGLKVGFTITGDLNKSGNGTKTLATISSAFGIMPGIAMAVGGYLTQHFSVDSCLIFLCVYIVFLWIVCQALPETAPELHKDALKFKKIFHNYVKQFKDTYLITYAFLAGLATALLYLFSTIAPYLGVELLQLTPESYGYWALIPSFGLFSGAMISRKTGVKFPPRVNILSGILLILCASILLFLLFATGNFNQYTLFLTAYFLFMGANFVWSNALSKGLQGASDKSNGSAVMQFINMGVAMTAVLCIQNRSLTDIFLFPIVLAILIVLMFFSWFFLRKHH